MFQIECNIAKESDENITAQHLDDIYESDSRSKLIQRQFKTIITEK